MATETLSWSDVDQNGGTVGSAGTTTIMTGSPSSAINNVTFAGDVILDNNGAITLQILNISENSKVVVNAGTDLTTDSSTLPSGTIEINGGSFSAPNSSSTSGKLDITFGDTTHQTNTVTITDNALKDGNVTFSNVAPGDNITIAATWVQTKLVDVSAGVIKVEQADNGTVIATLYTAKDVDGNYYTSSAFKTSLDSNNNTIFVCFLPGSMIRTSKGDVAVEDLRFGDEVVTYNWQHNTEMTQPVIWAGKAHATVRPELADDEAGYPVRIIKNAIADGVPYKDMLITAEHCLFFDGKFVPVRMLVNGTSIFYDKSITSYDYYHVETAQHSVITADGMLTESYLDTGNRSAFQQAGKVVRIGGSVKSWAEDAGAPLCVDRAFVEPLFYHLAERSNTVADAHVPAEPVATTSNPDLHLVTETGATIRPIRHDGQQYSFMLPSGTKSVRIVSRASRPSDMIGPFVDDRRYMGVAVADVLLHCARQSYNITTHLQAEKPQGWHETDWTDCAWTNGDAVLPLDGSLLQGKMGILTLTIRAAGPYLINTQPTAEKQVRSA